MSDVEDPIVPDCRICYQRVPSIPTEAEIPSSNLALAEDAASGPYQLAIGLNKFWDVGQVLKISWWGREDKPVTPSLKNRVKAVAKKWDALCNISLDFGNYGDNADIRIAFVPDGTSWSYVGKDCYLSPAKGGARKDEPTMNFGWLHDRSTDSELQSVVLHEFGHALGCIHEHQNPEGGIQWDEKKVIAKFSGPNNFWNEAKIRGNILNPVATSMNSVFDPDSIMLYSFPAELTLNNRGTKENVELSPMDIQYIKKLYPPKGRAEGLFDTKDLAAPTDTPASAPAPVLPESSMFNTKKFDFVPAYSKPPKIAVGLSRINMACKANKAISANVDHIQGDSATISINTWDTSVLYGGAASWVEADQASSEWQFGVFDTQEQRNRNDTSSQTASKTIYFENPYDEPPEVVVALKLIDLENHRDYRVKAYATDIQEDCFTIHVDTWGDSILYAGAATWIAYPKGLAGTFSTSVESVKDKDKNSGDIRFPANLFAKKPEVRVFLNKIDTKCGADLRVKTWVEQVTQKGLTWHADTWDDTHLTQAGVSIIAWG